MNPTDLPPGTSSPAPPGVASRTRGRPSGTQTSRDAILAAARAEFAKRGYQRATVRSIAGAAGVDAAMINHHFGGKHGLFAASLQLPFDPAEEISAVLPGAPGELAERVMARFLHVWDEASDAAASVVRTAVQQDETVGQLREFVLDSVVQPLLATAGVAPAERGWRGALVASQFVGVIMIRYVVRIEPLAWASPAAVVAAVAPTVQRYLTGELGGGLGGGPGARDER